MKKYTELTSDQQIEAVNYCLNQLLRNVTEGSIKFNDELNGNGLQAAIDSACKEANQMRTPWLAHEYIVDAKVDPWNTAGDMLRSMARCTAEDALYSEPHEHVIPRIG